MTVLAWPKTHDGHLNHLLNTMQGEQQSAAVSIELTLKAAECWLRRRLAREHASPFLGPSSSLS